MQQNRSGLFRGRHFADEIIALCVRWYLRFSLSYRDLEELMAERGLSVDHTTVGRWVQRYAPELDRRVRAELKRTGTSWQVDETYVHVAGRWGVPLSSGRLQPRYSRFLPLGEPGCRGGQGILPQGLGGRESSSTSRHQRGRQSIVPQGSEEAEQERRLGRRCRCRTCPYLNNILEQDHRGVKRRINAKQGSDRSREPGEPSQVMK